MRATARRRTALLAATHADQVDAARLLIARGADVNAKDDMQDSPFLYAGAQGRLEILRLTLAAGADLKSTNRYGGTALIPAAHHGHVETVRELLKTKIDVDHVNRLGWTALLEAIILGDGGAAHTEIVRLLRGPWRQRCNLADAQGVTPLAPCRASRPAARIVEILRRAGATALRAPARDAPTRACCQAPAPWPCPCPAPQPRPTLAPGAGRRTTSATWRCVDGVAYGWRGQGQPRRQRAGVRQVGVGRDACFALLDDGRLLRWTRRPGSAPTR